ncbi:MAG: hypothetical protein O1I87_14310 [Cylindrospermopsis raciborskii PAMP2012]|uniref:hypothetical protein n=1 Tax=Cylindrospermopsis raciborskii TaxID=77022 RepID=UPI0022C6A540|nr:hypothetical protein [Cylindrospermopsis raciborskii]MCZ2203097.1 hypothetical protein [Cylindrospermopsis raciborskii PAMP2012]
MLSSFTKYLLHAIAHLPCSQISLENREVREYLAHLGITPSAIACLSSFSRIAIARTFLPSTKKKP